MPAPTIDQTRGTEGTQMSQFAQFEGRDVHASRVGVTGTVEIADEFHDDQEVVALVVGPVTKLEFGEHDGKYTRKHKISATEFYPVDAGTEDVSELLAEARKAAKRRRDQLEGQASLEDEIEADDEGSLSSAIGTADEEVAALDEAADES